MALSTRTPTPLVPQQQETDDVLVQTLNRVTTITLNRPKTLNALTIPMLRTLYSALKDVRDNQVADLVILKSSNEKAFCAGGDVLEIRNSVNTDGTMHKLFYVVEYVVDYMIGTLPVPFVALIHGITMGAGCGISVNGRFRVATERTLVAMPEVGVGLLPDAGASYVLPRLPNNLGPFIALTGHRLRGADAYHSGMATHYINSNQLAELESNLLALPFPTNQSVDMLLRSFQRPRIPAFSLSPHLSLIRRAFSTEASFDDVLRELRSDPTDFATTQLKAIMKMSPISLKITFQQMKLGKTMQFAEVFPLEYRLIQRLVANSNFQEGCRALLIDRDHNPKWVPARVEDVSDRDVQLHYVPLRNELNMSAKL